MIVSGIVLYAGITSAVESVKKIIHPEKPDYNLISLMIFAAAVVVKIILGRYVKAKGEQVNSGSLTASGSDAMFDAILSASVLASAIVYMASGLSLEAYVGVIIAGFIIKAHDWAVQLHGFYVDVETKEMTFDVVMSFDIRPKEGLQIIYKELKEAYPEYDLQIVPDVDVSD